LNADPSASPSILPAGYRLFDPWFGANPDAELGSAIRAGTPRECPRHLDPLRGELHLALPIVDLTGLVYDAARRALDALAPR